jgi:putative membrane protein insertion efficiency factor
MKKLITGLLIKSIRFYQKFVSPLKSRSCRFHPTCSTYILKALDKYGLIEGVKLATKRILSCHPFHPGGYDPID